MKIETGRLLSKLKCDKIRHCNYFKHVRVLSNIAITEMTELRTESQLLNASCFPCNTPLGLYSQPCQNQIPTSNK